MWFKYPQNLSNDKRILSLLNIEGGKGFGLYMYIIECMSKQPDCKLNFESLKAMRRKGFSADAMEKVVRDYNLFIIEGEEFSSVIQFFYFKNSTENGAPNSAKSDTQNSANPTQTERKPNENTTQTEETLKQKAVKETTSKSLKSNKKRKKLCLARVREDKKRKEIERLEEDEEKEKEKTTSSSPQTSAGGAETTKPAPGDSAAGKLAAEGAAAGGVPPAPPAPPVTPGTGEDDPEDPITPKHWHKLVDNLMQESSWLDLACMQSGYGMLLKRNIKLAAEIFGQHIMMYDNGDKLLDMKDVHRYFVNYVRAGRATSKELEQKLMDIEAENRAAQAAIDPHRYEKRIDGKRTYKGCLIPSYAPPRPDETAFWNDLKRIWISQKSAKDTPI